MFIIKALDVLEHETEVFNFIQRMQAQVEQNQAK